MPLFAQQQMTVVPDWVGALVSGILFLTLAIWIFFIGRLLEGKAILPAYRPRRPVSWTGVDLLLIVFFFLSLSLIVGASVRFAANAAGNQNIEREEKRPVSEQKIEKGTMAHPLAQLLKNKDPWAIAVSFTVGVIIAPLCEELFFRVLVLGWLDSVERRWRRKWRWFLRGLPWGILPIVLSALMFAAGHIRKESPETEENHLMLGMLIGGIVSLLTAGFALGLVAYRTGATAKDLGWEPSKIGCDIRTGVIAFFSIFLPLLATQIFLAPLLMPKNYAPDPIAIFFLAIVLGLLYYRTHRLVPSLVVHVLLNSFSLIMVCSLG